MIIDLRELMQIYMHTYIYIHSYIHAFINYISIVCNVASRALALNLELGMIEVPWKRTRHETPRAPAKQQAIAVLQPSRAEPLVGGRLAYMQLAIETVRDENKQSPDTIFRAH